MPSHPLAYARHAAGSFARLAVAAPWIVLLLMSFQTTAIRQYASPGGVLVLGIGFGVCVLAYVSMMRIGRLPTEKRILS
jgi:tight adherence protein B